MGRTPKAAIASAQRVRLAASRTAEGRTRVVVLGAPVVQLGSGLAPTLEQKRPAAGQDHDGPLETASASVASRSDGKPRSWIMLLPQGQYNEPRYGKLNITPQLLSQLKATFDSRVRQIDIALDEDHDAGKATGWLEAVEVRSAGTDAQGNAAPAGLWGLVRWTTLGESDLRGELYRYFSIEYGPYKDIATGKKYPNVIWGGGLTNRPVMKRLPPIALSEGSRSVSRAPWSQVKKSCLPRSCFLIQGDPNDKSTWKLPIYEGAGPKDAAGHYTKRGALNLNAVRAALAAIGGARTGSPMTGVPSGLKARLERLLARYGNDGNGKSTQAAGTPAKQHSEGSRQVAKRTTHKQVVHDVELDEMDLDEGAEDDELFDFADDEDMADASYDEQDGGADDDEGTDDGDTFDKSSDTHGAMTTDGHAHGKFAEHSHDGDGDHSEAPMKQAARKKASEGRGHSHVSHAPASSAEVRTLNERLAAREHELEEMRFALYERDVTEKLDGWRGQTFQFKEGKTRDGKPVMRQGKIAMSKTFADAYKAFMLSEAIRLPKATRVKLNELIEGALSTAIVDLSARGSAFDQESRRTLKSGERGGMVEESAQIEEVAVRLLSEQGKTLAELTPAAQLALYERAEKEVRSR